MVLETTWIVAGMFSWILLPVGVSFLLLPDFVAFYASLDSTVVLKAFLFGCMWGIGNVNYGLTMRYLGMSLGIGVAMGVTLVVGTFVPAVLHGQFSFLFTTRSGIFTVAGVLLALIGVATVAAAGAKERATTGQVRRTIQPCVRACCWLCCAECSHQGCRLPSTAQSP